MRRSPVSLLLGVAGGALTVVALRFRKSFRQRERVDVYFEDGSFVTFGAGSREAARLLPLARQVLTAARSR